MSGSIFFLGDKKSYIFSAAAAEAMIRPVGHPLSYNVTCQPEMAITKFRAHSLRREDIRRR